MTARRPYIYTDPLTGRDYAVSRREALDLVVQYISEHHPSNRNVGFVRLYWRRFVRVRP